MNKYIKDNILDLENIKYNNLLEKLLLLFSTANNNNDIFDTDFFTYEFKGPFQENNNLCHVNDGFIG
jgi:hypothetical protein